MMKAQTGMEAAVLVLAVGLAAAMNEYKPPWADVGGRTMSVLEADPNAVMEQCPAGGPQPNPVQAYQALFLLHQRAGMESKGLLRKLWERMSLSVADRVDLGASLILSTDAELAHYPLDPRPNATYLALFGNAPTKLVSGTPSEVVSTYWEAEAATEEGPCSCDAFQDALQLLPDQTTESALVVMVGDADVAVACHAAAVCDGAKIKGLMAKKKYKYMYITGIHNGMNKKSFAKLFGLYPLGDAGQAQTLDDVPFVSDGGTQTYELDGTSGKMVKNSYTGIAWFLQQLKAVCALKADCGGRRQCGKIDGPLCRYDLNKATCALKANECETCGAGSPFYMAATTEAAPGSLCPSKCFPCSQHLCDVDGGPGTAVVTESVEQDEWCMPALPVRVTVLQHPDEDVAARSAVRALGLDRTTFGIHTRQQDVHYWTYWRRLQLKTADAWRSGGTGGNEACPCDAIRHLLSITPSSKNREFFTLVVTYVGARGPGSTCATCSVPELRDALYRKNYILHLTIIARSSAGGKERGVVDFLERVGEKEDIFSIWDPAPSDARLQARFSRHYRRMCVTGACVYDYRTSHCRADGATSTCGFCGVTGRFVATEVKVDGPPIGRLTPLDPCPSRCVTCDVNKQPCKSALFNTKEKKDLTSSKVMPKVQPEVAIQAYVFIHPVVDNAERDLLAKELLPGLEDGHLGRLDSGYSGLKSAPTRHHFGTLKKDSAELDPAVTDIRSLGNAVVGGTAVGAPVSSCVKDAVAKVDAGLETSTALAHDARPMRQPLILVVASHAGIASKCGDGPSIADSVASIQGKHYDIHLTVVADELSFISDPASDLRTLTDVIPGIVVRFRKDELEDAAVELAKIRAVDELSYSCYYSLIPAKCKLNGTRCDTCGAGTAVDPRWAHPGPLPVHHRSIPPTPCPRSCKPCENYRCGGQGEKDKLENPRKGHGQRITDAPSTIDFYIIAQGKVGGWETEFIPKKLYKDLMYPELGGEGMHKLGEGKLRIVSNGVLGPEEDYTWWLGGPVGADAPPRSKRQAHCSENMCSGLATFCAGLPKKKAFTKLLVILAVDLSSLVDPCREECDEKAAEVRAACKAQGYNVVYVPYALLSGGEALDGSKTGRFLGGLAAGRGIGYVDLRPLDPSGPRAPASADPGRLHPDKSPEQLKDIMTPSTQSGRCEWPFHAVMCGVVHGSCKACFNGHFAIDHGKPGKFETPLPACPNRCFADGCENKCPDLLDDGMEESKDGGFKLWWILLIVIAVLLFLILIILLVICLRKKDKKKKKTKVVVKPMVVNETQWEGVTPLTAPTPVQRTPASRVPPPLPPPPPQDQLRYPLAQGPEEGVDVDEEVGVSLTGTPSTLPLGTPYQHPPRSRSSRSRSTTHTTNTR